MSSSFPPPIWGPFLSRGRQSLSYDRCAPAPRGEAHPGKPPRDVRSDPAVRGAAGPATDRGGGAAAGGFGHADAARPRRAGGAHAAADARIRRLLDAQVVLHMGDAGDGFGDGFRVALLEAAVDR